MNRQVDSQESYENHLTELSAMTGLKTHSWTVGRRCDGSVISRPEFGVSMAPKALRATYGSKPAQAQIDSLVDAVADEVGKIFSEPAADVKEDIQKAAARSGATATAQIKMINSAISEITAAHSKGSDSRQGEIRALELLSIHLGQ